MANRTIALFGCDSCTPCKQLKPMLDEFCEMAQADLVVYDMAKDRDTFLRMNVRGTPTIMFIDEKNEEAGRIIGAQTFSSLNAAFRRWGLI